MKKFKAWFNNDMFSDIKRNLIWLAVIAVIITILVLIPYLIKFNGWEFSSNKADWGTFGDYIGGVLNPFFAFLSFIALLFTIIYQQESQRKQDKLLYKENFEASFFRMLNLYNEIVDSVRGDFKGNIATSRDALEKYQTELIASLDDAKSLDNAVETYIKFYKKHNSVLGHYFRNLYMIVKFIDESDLDRDDNHTNSAEIVQRKKYTSIVRAQLSNPEQVLLFYNCTGNDGIEKFYPLINKYAFFENLDIRLLRPENIVQAYEQRAFGNKSKLDGLLQKNFEGDSGEYRRSIEKRRAQIAAKITE